MGKVETTEQINSKRALLRPLILMQLKDKINFSFLKSTRSTIFKIIYSILLFVGLTVGIYFIFKLVILLGLFSFLKSLNFRVFLVLMAMVFLLSFLSCLVSITKTLYFSKDNQVLLTMPVGTSTLFISKIIVCFLYELLKNATYILPFFIAYGLIMNLAIPFYLWAILSLVFFTILSVSLCGLLSIPAMGVSILFRRHKVLEFVTLGIISVLLIVGVVSVINLIPADIDLVRDWGKIYWSVQDFLKSFAISLFPLTCLLEMLTGMSYGTIRFNPFTTKNLITFSICFGLILVCFVTIILLSKRIFLKMASNPFEYRKKEVFKNKKNSKKLSFISSVIRQTQVMLRSSDLVYSVLATAVLMPIAILLQNRIIAAMDTRILGKFMGISFNVLIILLMSLSSSVSIASTFSRDGNSSYINKTGPVPYALPLTSKLVFNALLMSLSIILSCEIINIFVKIGTMATILLSISLVLLYLAHLFWSAELDIMNPQTRQYQTTGTNQRNPNEIKSSIISFILSGIFAFVTYFLINENIKVVWLKLLILALVVFVTRIYFYFTRIKLYYKEK